MNFDFGRPKPLGWVHRLGQSLKKTFIFIEGFHYVNFHIFKEILKFVSQNIKQQECFIRNHMIVGIYPRGTWYESLYCGLGTEQDIWGQISPNGEKGSMGSEKWGL